MNDNKVLREELVKMLKGGNAHATFEQTVDDFPMRNINTINENFQKSAWQLLEHLRIAQWDILDFMINPNYKNLVFPDDYWPKENFGTEKQWNESIFNFQKDFDAIIKIVENPETDFFSPIPHALKYNIFREILLIADHNAYHIGQLFLIKKSFIK